MASEPGRFHTAALHYLQGRPAYAPALIRRVAQVCGLGAGHRVLDLGCGPGQLALAFAPLAGQVVAVDPEPEMLRIAREEAARAGLPIEFREGSSRDLGPEFGLFRLAVIGRAFHWMDRAETLRRLDAVIEPAGAAVLFGDDHPPLPDNRWHEAFDKLIDRYAEGDPERASRGRPTGRGMRPSCSIRRSPTSNVFRSSSAAARRSDASWTAPSRCPACRTA